MKTKTKYFCFSSNWKAKIQMRDDLLENIQKESSIFNQKIEIDLEREIFQINFSTILRKNRSINVHITIEGLRDMKILIRTPFSFGYSFSERKKLKKILRSSLNETLKYY